MANYSHHNSNRAWHLDRQKFNKNEDWEEPMRSRKLRYKAKRKPQKKKFLGIFEGGGVLPDGMPDQIVKLDYETKKKNLEKRNEIFLKKNRFKGKYSNKFFDDVLKMDNDIDTFYTVGYSLPSRGKAYDLKTAFLIKRKVESYFDNKGENILVFVMESPIPLANIYTMREWMDSRQSYVVMVNEILSEQEYNEIGLNKFFEEGGSIYESGGGVGVQCFCTNYSKGINNIYAINPEGDGLGWIPNGSKVVRNVENIKKQVNSLADLSFIADIPVYDGVWTYDPINEGAEIHFYQHTGYTKIGNLIFNRYVFIIECDKYDEDGEELDTFGIDWLEDACKKQNVKNGLVDNETHFQLYDYMNKFIEDEKDKIYASGGGVDNEYQAIQVATEDIDGMSDEEVADYLGIEPDEVNYQYRNDAIDKRTEELLELWKKEGYASGGGVELIYIGKNKYKYRDFEFEVEEGELNMTSPEFYEGQEIYGSEPTLSEIKSVIADYFDFENRDMKNYPITEDESTIINKNFSEQEQKEIFGMTFTNYASKEIIVNDGDYEVKYIITYVPTGDWTDTYNLSINRYSDEFGGSQHSVMKILSKSEAERMFNKVNESNAEDMYRFFANSPTHQKKLFEEGGSTYASGGGVNNDNYASGGAIGLSKKEKSIIDDRLDYYYENNEYTKDVDILVDFVIEGGEIDASKYNEIKKYIKSNFESGGGVEYSKGGRAGKRRTKNYNYIPNRMIQSVEVKKGRKVTEIDGDNILDGVYVKGKVKFAGGGHLESDKENQVRSNLVDGRIEMNTLKEIIGCEPNYPNQIVGSIKLEKCFLLPYYRLA